MAKFVHVWRRKSVSSASHFVSALERVRDIREHSSWEPLTAQSNIRQRADRLVAARERVKIPALASERETPESAGRYFRTAMFWRWFLYPLVVFMAALALYVYIPERPAFPQISQAPMVFPGLGYTNLTDKAAERFARRALTAAGLEPSEWLWAERHALDSEQIITFHRADDHLTIVLVTVKLEPGERIVCTVNPQ